MDQMQAVDERVGGAGDWALCFCWKERCHKISLLWVSKRWLAAMCTEVGGDACKSKIFHI